MAISYYVPVSHREFEYTWSDQHFTIPATWLYTFKVKWAGSDLGIWWYAEASFELTQWDELSIMVWESWSKSDNATYWFWWSANYWWDSSGWWLSWVFTGSEAIWANDASRALIIAWGAWWTIVWQAWWNWGWETWQWWWGGSYGTAWWWGTQTWHWSWWNASSDQFRWWNGSGVYGAWWGWWRWWGNGSAWDGSAVDDRWAWGWSWYINPIWINWSMTQWWAWAVAQDWFITIDAHVSSPTSTLQEKKVIDIIITWI